MGTTSDIFQIQTLTFLSDTHPTCLLPTQVVSLQSQRPRLVLNSKTSPPSPVVESLMNPGARMRARMTRSLDSPAIPSTLSPTKRRKRRQRRHSSAGREDPEAML